MTNQLNLQIYRKRFGASLAAALTFSSAAALADGLNFSDLEFQAGAAAIVSPKYEGGKRYEVIAVPFAFPGGKGGDDDLTFNDIDSVQYRFVKSGPFEAGVLGGLWLGRSDSDSARLAGLGDIDAGLVLGGFGAYNLGPVKFTASYHRQVTDDVGGLVRLRADATLPVSPGLKFLAGIGTNYADDAYMREHFGVDPAQAARSGARLGVFDANAGFKNVFAGAGFEYEFSERWTAKLYGEYSRLTGDAADSPVIETKDQFSGLFAITYQFGPSGTATASTDWAPQK